MPISGWLAGGLRDYMHDLLSRERIARQGIFNPDAVSDLIRRFDGGDGSLAIRIYTLLAFQVWHESSYLKSGN